MPRNCSTLIFYFRFPQVASAMLQFASRTKAYLTFHSYGQYFLYPWGWTASLPDDAVALHTLATNAANKLKEVYGTEYTIGSAASTLCKLTVCIDLDIRPLINCLNLHRRRFRWKWRLGQRCRWYWICLHARNARRTRWRKRRIRPSRRRDHTQ